jgi:hypothetical protein
MIPRKIGALIVLTLHGRSDPRPSAEKAKQ